MNARFEQKAAIVRQILEGRISREEGAAALGSSSRTIRRYLRAFLNRGPEGLSVKDPCGKGSSP